MAQSTIQKELKVTVRETTGWISNQYKPTLYSIGDNIYALIGTFKPTVAITGYSTVIASGFPPSTSFVAVSESGTAHNLYTNTGGQFLSRKNISANTTFYLGIVFVRP